MKIRPGRSGFAYTYLNEVGRIGLNNKRIQSSDIQADDNFGGAQGAYER